MMKLQFSSNLPYQEQAIASVIDLFAGQPYVQSNFTVNARIDTMGIKQTENGIGNRLELDEESILHNLQNVQLRNGLKQSPSLQVLKDQVIKYDFDVEMETGTGKTYVYLRTILEMNKLYGFTKFLIVVPSIAIKEGTYKSLQITKEHFANLYDNIIYNYFIYDSSKPDQVHSFAVNNHISIMVINIDAFRKNVENTDLASKANIINRPYDKLNGMRPIDLIKETSPFVIIDEPQSVDTTPKSKEAIASLNPLCIFRYSATHKEKHNLIYRLDAIDSFEMGLVKQIEVASFTSLDNHNNPYFLLKSVNNKKSPITAKLVIDVREGDSIKRKEITVKHGDDLFEKSKNRDMYEGYIIEEIYCEAGNEYISFTSKPEVLRLNEIFGDVDDIVIKEQQIRKTIEEHLDKEKELNKKGIKVLSLFFIDRVANYRIYGENGETQKGIYAQLFEKNYLELIKKPKYNTLMHQMNEADIDFNKIHDGYFSLDKGKKIKDTNGETQADNDTYNLIMRDKEKLLSLDNGLRFIFSHSALREGWDNPNVFQICTLNETKSEDKKRQEIGRGLRLCVNQDGERQYGENFNVLTVMANESYQVFAEKLQKEYEDEQGIKFGVLEKHSFAHIVIRDARGEVEYFGSQKSEKIYDFLQAKEYIDAKGKIQDSMKSDLKKNILQLPDDLSDDLKPQVLTLCKKISGNLNIKDANTKRAISVSKGVFEGQFFKELWEHIKWKTTYAVDFDSEKLIEECVTTLKRELSVASAKLLYTKAELDIAVGGIEATENTHTVVTSTQESTQLPDIVTFLQNRTNLTRKTIVDILVQSHTLDSFKRNPQKYMEEVAKTIVREMRKLLVDGIKYTKLGDSEFYAQELFINEELFGYLEKNMFPSEKSVHEYIVYDSDNEMGFAEKFEKNDAIKLYFKLPNWFKIPTPIGSYNPDWAILIEDNGQNKFYFVVETKGGSRDDSLRPTELYKIKCGYKHFEALGDSVHFDVTNNFDEFLEKHNL